VNNAADSGCPPWCVLLIEELNASDQRANALARGLSVADLNWKPAPDAWSIGQCLQHLQVANDVYLPPIARALEGEAPSPVQAINPGWFGRWFIRKYIEPSPRSTRAQAPRKIAPAPHIDASILDQFLRSNEAARDLVRRAGAYDVNRIRFENPFVPLLRFTVGTGLKVITRHQHRHLLQAERIRQTPGFPKLRFHGGEIVRLRRDLEALKAGCCGVLWGVYGSEPVVYEATFVDAAGSTDATFSESDVHEVPDVQLAPFSTRLEEIRHALELSGEIRPGRLP
jgi:hypothetical protein